MALDDLALDAPNSLLSQCTAAREMSWGNDNLDGWGYVYVDDDGQHHYRSAAAFNEDVRGQSGLREVWPRRFLLHIRQKTPGSATAPVNTAPFSDPGGYFFSHNGYVTGFRDGVREQLLAKVSPERTAGIEGDTDSELLFAMVLDRLYSGAAAPDAIRILADVADRYGGRYNTVLMHPNGFVATRWNNSLYLSTDRGALASSEPIGDHGWRSVPDHSMVVVSHSGVRQEQL
jgi:glutamine amidotransferase